MALRSSLTVMPCRSFSDPLELITVPVAGSKNRDRQLVSERDADGRCGLTRRILLVDFLDRDQEVQAARLELARRAVGEPEEVPLRIQVAGHVARKHDVVEDDQPGRWVVAEEADVGGQRVGCRKIPDRAVAVDLDLRRRRVDDRAIDDAAEVGDAVFRLRRAAARSDTARVNSRMPIQL